MNPAWRPCWSDGPDSDIHAAQLSVSGDVVDAYSVFAQVGTQVSPSVAGGPENEVLSACSGWADSVGNHPASAMRTWGKLLPITEDCPCGDCNGDGRITAADATYIVGYIFRAGPGLVCNCDVNVDARITAADATYIISYLYRAGPPPCNPPVVDSRSDSPFLQRGSQ